MNETRTLERPAYCLDQCPNLREATDQHSRTLAELDAAQARIAELEARESERVQNAPTCPSCDEMDVLLGQAHDSEAKQNRKLSALEADRARLDWIQDGDGSRMIEFFTDEPIRWEVSYWHPLRGGWVKGVHPTSLRDAIAAAMKRT